MKRFLKIIMILIMIITVITKVYADSPVQVSELAEKQIFNCTNGSATLAGCFYTDDTASQYENIASGTVLKDVYTTGGWEEVVYVDELGTDYPVGIAPDGNFTIKSMKFERAYTSINKAGNTVVGACYKGYIKNVVDKRDVILQYVTGEIYATPQSPDDMGVIYLRVFNDTTLHHTCKSPYKEQLIFQDPKRAHDTYKKDDTANLVPNVASERISVVGYDAYKDMQCPKYMSFTENLSGAAWLFYPQYEYTFSDDENVRHMNNFFENIIRLDTTGKIKGCIEEAVEYHDAMNKCFDEKAEEVKKYNCPEKLTDIKIDTKAYADECAEEMQKKYNVDLESARFLARQTIENAPKFKEALRSIVDECYKKALSNTCKLTQSEITDVLNKLKGTICENLCDTGTKPDNMDPNGVCYSCRGSKNVAQYVWSVNTPSGCGKNGKTIDECYGDQNNENCRNCYHNAVAGIDDDKKACVLELIGESQKAISDGEDDIDNGFQEHEDETNEDNAERMREMYLASLRLFYIPGLENGGFGPKGQSCDEVLQKNVVKMIKGSVNVLRIAGAIVAIANAMIALIPAVIAKDADGLKKASKKLVTMAVVLALIGILPSIIKLIGLMFDYDLTCLF